MKSTKLNFLIALFFTAFIFAGCPSNNTMADKAAAEEIEDEDYDYEEDVEDDGDDEWDDLDTSGIDYDYIESDSIETDSIDF